MAMSLLFMDGCSHYDAASILQKWHSGSATMDSTVRHGAGQSLLSPVLLRRNFPSVSEVIVTGAFRVASLAGADQVLCRIFDGTGTPTTQLELVAQVTTGIIRVKRGAGGTLIGAVGPAILENTWYYFEFGALIANGVAGKIDVRIHDGTSMIGSIATTGLDTAASATSTAADAIVFDSPGNRFQDIELRTGTAYSLSDFNGDSKIVTLRPAAAGPDADWTIGGSAPASTNHESVDEVLADELVTLVSSNTPTDRDTHELEELDSTVATVNAVQSVTQWRKDDTAVRAANHSYRNAAGSYFDSAAFTLPADWTMDLVPMELNPDTGLPFTRAEVNPPATWGFLLST